LFPARRDLRLASFEKDLVDQLDGDVILLRRHFALFYTQLLLQLGDQLFLRLVLGVACGDALGQLLRLAGLLGTALFGREHALLGGKQVASQLGRLISGGLQLTLRIGVLVETTANQRRQSGAGKQEEQPWQCVSPAARQPNIRLVIEGERMLVAGQRWRARRPWPRSLTQVPPSFQIPRHRPIISSSRARKERLLRREGGRHALPSIETSVLPKFGCIYAPNFGDRTLV